MLVKKKRGGRVCGELERNVKTTEATTTMNHNGRNNRESQW